MALIKDGHIGYRECTALLAVMLTTKVFLSCPRDIIIHGQTAAWLLMLVALTVNIIGILPLLSLARTYPNQSIIEIAEEVGGPLIGIFVALVLFAFFLGNTVLIMRQFTETVIVAFLPNTPISVITVTFLLAMVYASYQGIEALSRTAWLLIPFIILGLAGVLALILPKANLNLIYPIWGSGLPKVLSFGILKSSLMSEILIFSLLNPYIRKREKVNSIVLSALIISGVLFSVTLAVYVMVFPVPSGISAGTYPLYNLARLIYYGRFLQRVESIFIFIWVFSLLVNVSVLFYATVISMGRGLKLSFYHPLIFPMAVLVYGFNFLVPSFISAVQLDADVLHTYGFIPAFSVPALVWLLAKIRGKKAQATAQC